MCQNNNSTQPQASIIRMQQIKMYYNVSVEIHYMRHVLVYTVLFVHIGVFDLPRSPVMSKLLNIIAFPPFSKAFPLSISAFLVATVILKAFG